MEVEFDDDFLTDEIVFFTWIDDIEVSPVDKEVSCDVNGRC